jgi:hypothetical protein
MLGFFEKQGEVFIWAQHLQLTVKWFNKNVNILYVYKHTRRDKVWLNDKN